MILPRSVPRTYPPSFPRLFSGTAKGESGCAGGTMGFCFPRLLPQSKAGPLPPKQPLALGSSPPSRPCRLNAPSRSGERNGGFKVMYRTGTFHSSASLARTQKRAPPKTRKPTPCSARYQELLQGQSPASTSLTPSGIASSYGESSASSPSCLRSGAIANRGRARSREYVDREFGREALRVGSAG